VQFGFVAAVMALADAGDEVVSRVVLPVPWPMVSSGLIALSLLIY
jgi:hypothetical protein